MWHVVKDQLLPILVADFSRWRFKVRGKTPMKALMIWSESFFFGLEWSHRFCLELFPFRNLLDIKIITFLYIANVWRWNDFDVLRTCTSKTCWAKICKCLRWLAFAALLPGAGSPKKSAASARPRVLRKRSFGVGKLMKQSSRVFGFYKWMVVG